MLDSCHFLLLSGVQDLNLDLSQWQPIVEDRCLVSWLVKAPSDTEMTRARQLNLDQINKLEDVSV